MNWEVILWSSATLLTLITICAVVFTFISSRSVKKRGQQMGLVQTELKVGSKVLFAAGLVGKITKVGDETIHVELCKGMVVEASRYSVNSIL